MSSIDLTKLVVHQKEDGSVQLRDETSLMWCACGNPAFAIVEENVMPYQLLCTTCWHKQKGPVTVSAADYLQGYCVLILNGYSPKEASEIMERIQKQMEGNNL